MTDHCKGCYATIENGQFCDKCKSTPVYAGYSKSALHDAFNLVQNPKNWKLSINKTVSCTAEMRDTIRASIIFFTGSVPNIAEKRNGYKFTAPGYYRAVGA